MNSISTSMLGLLVFFVMASSLSAASLPAGVSAPSSASLEQLAAAQSYSDLPPPPPKPEKFTSKQQLKDYLIKLHEYYAIIGRPRFGRRSFDMTEYNSNNDDLFESGIDKLLLDMVDHNRDGYASKKEINDFTKIWNQL